MTAPPSAPSAPKPVAPPARRLRTLALIIPAVVVFTSPIWLAIGFRVWGFEAFRIASGAMSPGLLVGDRIFVNKHAGGVMPERGDVVLFEYPLDRSKDFLSRVVGLPGDRVLVRPGGDVEINGTPLPRCALGRWQSPDRAGVEYEASLEQNGTHRYVVLHDPNAIPVDNDRRTQCVATPCEVPAGHVLTLGDHRENSYDGRFWGFVPVESVRGRAASIFQPAKSGPPGRWMHAVNDAPVVGPELAPALGRCMAGGR